MNKYDLSGKYGIGWTSNTNKEFYFDLEDYDKIKDYTWFENILSSGYSRLDAYNPSTRKTIGMHYLLGCKYYDHIDRNPLNNRKTNLRFATSQENARNRGVSKRNSSGFIGVHFDKEKNKWRSGITINYEHIRLGYFVNKDDAIRARLDAEAKYFGEFAPQRHLFEKYNIKVNA